MLDNAWRGAAAYHYYLLAQRQLYNGKMDAAMKTSIRLAEYEDVLDPKDIYSLVALTAYHNSYFGICSRAFIKLETMTGIEDEERETIQNLALQIFTKNPPLDPHQVWPWCACACLCACVRVCACACAPVRAPVCACVRMCVCPSTCCHRSKYKYGINIDGCVAARGIPRL